MADLASLGMHLWADVAVELVVQSAADGAAIWTPISFLSFDRGDSRASYKQCFTPCEARCHDPGRVAEMHPCIHMGSSKSMCMAGCNMYQPQLMHPECMQLVGCE